MTDAALRFAPATSVSLDEYAAAFTSAFQGYFHPVAMDGAALARRVRFEQYDLEHSLVAYDGDEVAGVAALAARGDSGWCPGFGIVPEKRRRGRGRELMSALVESARKARLRRLSLEVLTRNEAARRLYESAGMRVTRDLLVFELAGGSADGGGEVGRTNEAPAAELLRHFERLHAVEPAWQRGLPALYAANLRGVYVGERERPDAYALLGRGGDGTTYVSDLGAADVESARAMCGVLARVGALKIINEPEHSLFAGPLAESGFELTERQHEMLLEL